MVKTVYCGTCLELRSRLWDVYAGDDFTYEIFDGIKTIFFHGESELTQWLASVTIVHWREKKEESAA